LASKAIESVRADPCTERLCRLGWWISAEPIEDEADNLFSNCLGVTRFLRPGVGNWCAFGLRLEQPASVYPLPRKDYTVRVVFVCARGIALL
jgi:hypothetical protein